MRILFVLLLFALLQACSQADDLYIEAEEFQSSGGWTIDVQSSDILGTPYLLAHGIGEPVQDAETEVNLPGTGKWHLSVKTYNWTSPWSAKKGPGSFQVLINGQQIGADSLGRTLRQWGWEYVGEFQTLDKKVKISLHDLTGFDGRIDAIYISRNRDINKVDTPKRKISRKEKFDLVIVGGGISGICAAVSAARLGLSVALVNDYEKLGGNNSSLVRVHLGGEICKDPYPKLGALINEFGHTRSGNAMPEDYYEDWKKDSIIASEKNISLYTPYHFTEARTNDNKIESIIIRNNKTGERVQLESVLFADCTGDGTLGVAAGADSRYGRESYNQHKERSAPVVSDSLTMGGSIQWYSEESDDSRFPLFEYGMNFTDSSALAIPKGDWVWETGMNQDMITDVEKIRDYGLLAVYSNWSYVKNIMGLNSGRKLKWVSYVLGKRESRRLLGDVILTEEDIMTAREFDDASVTTTWSIDLHYPNPENSKYFPDQEFISMAKCIKINPYPIPYRCFYSRNIDNLFMAGRDISVTHIALGTTRVMRTCGMMGEVVGMAASVCKNNGCLPRNVYSDYLNQLKDLMTKGVGNEYEFLDRQNFNTK